MSETPTPPARHCPTCNCSAAPPAALTERPLIIGVGNDAAVQERLNPAPPKEPTS